MKNKVLKKILEIYGITYYFFSLIASCILLVEILEYYNISNKYTDYLAYLLCLGGHITVIYIILKDNEHEKK